LAARRAAIARGCTDLLGVAVRYLVTRTAGSNTFFATVLPKADAFKASRFIAVAIGAAQSVVATRNVGGDGTDLANRDRGRTACVEAWAARAAGTLFGAVVVDVGTELAEPRAIFIEMAGLEGANAEVRRWGHLADVALRAVEVAVTWHATIDTGACLAGKAERTIVALSRRAAARCDPHAVRRPNPDRSACVVRGVRTFSHGSARATVQWLALLDRFALIGIAARVDADISAKRAVVVGVARKLRRAGVAKRIGHAGASRTAGATRAAGAARAACPDHATHAAGPNNAGHAAATAHASTTRGANTSGGSGSTGPSGSPGDRRAAITAADQERERHRANRPQAVAGDAHSRYGFGSVHLD